MKKVISGLLIVVIVLCNCIVAKGDAKNIDKLYADAFNSVVKCERERTQSSVNSAREAIKKLIGTVDWAVGEFSKKVDKIQHPILVEIVDGIQDSQDLPFQWQINGIRKLINDLPVPQWRSTYSSALDVAQNELIKRTVDWVNMYKAEKSYEYELDAREYLQQLAISNSADVVNFSKTLAKEAGITLQEISPIHITKIIEHNNPIYKQYGLTNNEFVMEVSGKTVQEVKESLYEFIMGSYSLNIVSDDGERIHCEVSMVIEPSEKSKSPLIVMSINKYYDSVGNSKPEFLKDGSRYELNVDWYSEEIFKFDCPMYFIYEKNYSLRPQIDDCYDYNKSNEEILNDFMGIVKSYNSLKGESCVQEYNNYRDLEVYLEVLMDKGAITCENIDKNAYGMYKENGDKQDGYVYRRDQWSSKNYEAFRNVSSIKELQAVINKIDKEYNLLKKQYNKIGACSTGGFLFEGEKNISSIIKTIKTKASIDEKEAEGIKIGFYDKGIYNSAIDVGYVYNSKTGDWDLRKGYETYGLSPELIVWKNGMVVTSTYENYVNVGIKTE